MADIIISNCYDEQEFKDIVRINGLLKYNMDKTGGKLKVPDAEIVRVARENEIENEAKALGCHFAHTTTYSFQAPLFYQKQGYTICGEIDGFPDDIKLYMLKKQL